MFSQRGGKSWSQTGSGFLGKDIGFQVGAGKAGCSGQPRISVLQAV